MKILHLCRQYWPSVGGVERFVSELAARLSARGHQVEVATLNRLWRHPDRLAPTETVSGIPVQRVPFLGGALFYAAPAILQLVHPFDVLHIHNTDFFLDYLTATRSIHRKPIVVSTHGGFFHTADHSLIKRLYFALVTRGSLRAARVVLPNSPADERRFGPHAARCMRIDNAIEFAKFARVQPHPIPGRLLTVGRLAPNKNIATLIDTLVLARRQRGDLTLTIVGDGQQRAELERRTAAKGLVDAVRWCGAVSEEVLLSELASAELFVSSASYEGFGLALLEAMAAGLPSAVNNIEAFRDVVEDGRNGFLIDYADPVSAAAHWLEVLSLSETRRAEIGQRAKQTASGYDWAIALPKFEEAYRLAIETAQLN